MAPLSKSERELWARVRCGGGRKHAEAAFELASLLKNRRQLKDAEWLLRDVVKRTEGATAAEAWMRLAVLFEEQGKEVYAENAYERAAGLIEPGQAPEIALELAAYHEKSGRPGPARLVYEYVLCDGAVGQVRSVAAFRLARLLRRDGDRDRVVGLLRVAMEDGGSAGSLHIAMLLAEELTHLSPGPGSAEAAEAEDLLQTVMQADHPDLSPEAALTLARLQQRRRRLHEAYRLCQLVIDSGNPSFLEEAHELQSLLLHIELEGPDLVGDSAGPPAPGEGSPTANSPGSSITHLVSHCLLEHTKSLEKRDREGVRYWTPLMATYLGSVPDHDKDCPLCAHPAVPPPEPPRRRPFGAAVQAAMKRLLGGASPAPVLSARIHAYNTALQLPVVVDPSPRSGLSRLRLHDVRERLLGELLLEVIESEAFDLQTVRALVAELAPQGDSGDLIEHSLLVPHTSTIGELAIGRYCEATEEAECAAEKGCASGEGQGFLWTFIPDNLERLCNVNWDVEIDRKLAHGWLWREEKLVIEHCERRAEHPHL